MRPFSQLEHPTHGLDHCGKRSFGSLKERYWGGWPPARAEGDPRLERSLEYPSVLRCLLRNKRRPVSGNQFFPPSVCLSRCVKFCRKRCAHLNQGKDGAEESEDLTFNSSLLHLQTSCVSWASHPTSLCLSDPICQMGGWVGHLRLLLPYDAALPHLLGCGGKWSTTRALQHHHKLSTRRGFAHKLSTRLTWPLLSRDAENQGNQKIFIH